MRLALFHPLLPQPDGVLGSKPALQTRTHFRFPRIARWLLIALVAWPGLTSSLVAQTDEPTPAPKPNPPAEEENPPVVQTPKKGGKRHRPPTRIHSTGNERVEIGKDVVVRKGETVSGLVVIAADATVDGTVQGDLVVISGTAKVNGRVDHDLVTILGSASLGPEAQIGQNAVVVGGPLKINPAATIGGEQTVVALGPMVPNLMGLQKWLTKGLFLARPFPPQVHWVWIIAGVCLLVYLALTVVFPRPVLACVDALERQPVASFLVGVLLFVLVGPLLFLLVVSVAGILVIPFLALALIAATIFGKIAVYSYAGQQVGRQVHIPEPSLPLMLIIGAVLFYLLYMVPVLGFAVWGLVTLLGLGAVLLAAFGSFRRDEALAYAPPQLAFAAPAVASFPPAPEAAPAGSAPITATAAPPVTPIDFALLPHVGFWRRALATILDFLLLCLLIHVTGPLFLLLWLAYHVGMWAWRGTTVGGIVLGLKIVRQDGKPIDFGVALVRGLAAFFSAFALFLGFFWAGWDREKQSWHDKIAGTIIVRVPKGYPLI
jgi:uncharacterized RDD family membrane protein YckC